MRSPVPVAPVRSLGLLALVLVLIFALQVITAVVPWQPLNPAWQWRLANTLINGAPLPLLSLAVLQIGVVLDPGDPALRGRQRLFRQLAVVAALGFLLLLPLQISAGLRQQSAVGTAQRSRIDAAQQRLSSLRQATDRAGSNAELNSELQKLQGPVLSPADLANPLPLLKAQVNAVFAQAQIQIKRDRAALPPATPIAALPELLRNAVACLVLALGYGAFARRPGSDLTLVEEWQCILGGMRLGLRANRHAGRLSDAEYLAQLSGEEDD